MMTSIYGQRYTHIGESSAVWITDLYKALEFELPRLTRYLPVTLTGELEAFLVTVNIFHNLIYFPVNSHPTPLSSSLTHHHCL